jgi:hypothetical protein
MIVLYLAVAVVTLTLGTHLLLGNVTPESRGHDLIPIPCEPDSDRGSDR